MRGFDATEPVHQNPLRIPPVTQNARNNFSAGSSKDTQGGGANSLIIRALSLCILQCTAAQLLSPSPTLDGLVQAVQLPKPLPLLHHE